MRKHRRHGGARPFWGNGTNLHGRTKNHSTGGTPRHKCEAMGARTSVPEVQLNKGACWLGQGKERFDGGGVGGERFGGGGSMRRDDRHPKDDLKNDPGALGRRWEGNSNTLRLGGGMNGLKGGNKAGT